MACNLYYRHSCCTFKVGTFQSREKAEQHWNCIKDTLKDRLGEVTPVYVEKGKGKGK